MDKTLPIQYQDGPFTEAFTITPHATNSLPKVTRGIWVGGAGAVDLVTPGGDSVTISGVAAGTLLPICAYRVLATSTATLMVGLV